MYSPFGATFLFRKCIFAQPKMHEFARLKSLCWICALLSFRKELEQNFGTLEKFSEFQSWNFEPKFRFWKLNPNSAGVFTFRKLNIGFKCFRSEAKWLSLWNTKNTLKVLKQWKTISFWNFENTSDKLNNFLKSPIISGLT